MTMASQRKLVALSELSGGKKTRVANKAKGTAPNNINHRLLPKEDFFRSLQLATKGSTIPSSTRPPALKIPMRVNTPKTAP